jgi:excisionase family DNA binding protein
MSSSRSTILFLSIPVAAKQMGVGVERLKRAVRAGQVPSVEIGSRKLISRRAIERLAQLMEEN